MLLFTSTTGQIKTVQSFHIPRDDDEILWFGLRCDIQDPSLTQIKMHDHAKQSLLTFSDIPKVNEYKNEAVICLTALDNSFETEKINILVGKNYVITIEEKGIIGLKDSLTKLFNEEQMRMSHTGHILFHIINVISANYLAAIDEIADEILNLEKSVFKDPFENRIGKTAYRWKTKLHELRQIIEPQESVIKEIVTKEFPYTNEESTYYFQDIESDYSRIISAIDTFKENLVSIYNLQMSLKADHSNAIMKTLTLVSVIFIPMTFIAGLYGMNFEKMPELSWHYGYPAALIVMFGGGLSIAMFFRIKGWWGKNEGK
ncbi:magnesium/cobalt transporter CorA [Bacillus marasmi]|uniref:magnesium/cobalt transporter CorA n=1 Tax=Bacillus marasmi TaxID=1926279 RepID=UPI0011C7ECEC|nr:magnesium/cobalt transporter CorA [Bacillus marasmi]